MLVQLAVSRLHRESQDFRREPYSNEMSLPDLSPDKSILFDKKHFVDVYRRMLEHADRIRCQNGRHVLRYRMQRKRNDPIELILCRSTT